MEKLIYCPICDEEHCVKIIKSKTKVKIKEQNIECMQSFFVCDTTGEKIEFESGKMVNENLLAAKDAYRKTNGLLTSDEIKSIRNKYHLTQTELALILDWGEITITRYETKQIQDEAHDAILRMIDENPLEAFERLQIHKSEFAAERYTLLKDIFLQRIATEGVRNSKRQVLQNMYAGYDTPSELNGNTLLNIDKLIDIISYFALYIPNLYKVKLMKLLWYADSLAYQRTNKSMTGLVFLHEPLGALPRGHKEILALSELSVSETEYPESNRVLIQILPGKTIEQIALDDIEKNILNTVISKFRNYTAQEISDYMHEEEAYKKTSKNQPISFAFASQLRQF